MIPANGITVLTDIIYLKIRITINEKTEIVIIDFGIIGNFMIKKHVINRKHSIKIK